MIVRRSDEVLYCITQPDHAALAGRIMAAWPGLQQAARRQSIALAINQHDNGWLEPDAAPMVNPATARPFDFMNAPIDMRQAVWPRGVARLEGEDAWAAALLAHHAVSVYSRFRSDAAWRSFFEAMETRRDSLIARRGLSRSDLESDYVFVRIGDLISLIFCNAWTDTIGFEGFQFALTREHVTVSPDPFSGREVAATISARMIADVNYRSDEELRHAIRTARIARLEGIVTGANR